MAERWRALRAHAAFTAALTFVTTVFFFVVFFLLFMGFFIFVSPLSLSTTFCRSALFRLEDARLELTGAIFSTYALIQSYKRQNKNIKKCLTALVHIQQRMKAS
jgi:hypothetical protein